MNDDPFTSHGAPAAPPQSAAQASPPAANGADGSSAGEDGEGRGGGRAFLDGAVAGTRSAFLYVLFATFVGIGALAHDFGFSIWWMQLSTIFVWAGPAQVVLMSILGSGGRPIEAALAVTLSAVRLMPMVVSLLPLLRTPQTRTRHLIVPAHMTSISMWVESIRLLPAIPRADRVAFTNGLSTGYMLGGLAGGHVGFALAGGLPPLFAAGLLFLTPMVFLVSIIRNGRLLVDHLAFALGLFGGPLFAFWKLELDLVWSGLLGGTLAYAVHRLIARRRAAS